MNLSGIWKYTEDYTYGDCSGLLTLYQLGDSIEGSLFHKEVPLDGESFEVEQVIQAIVSIDNQEVILKAISVNHLKENADFEYELDCFQLKIITNNLMVGTSKDKQGILGVVSFKRTA